MAERVSSVEQNQQMIGQGIQHLGTGLTQSISSLQVQVNGLVERVTIAEQAQSDVSSKVQALGSSLNETVTSVQIAVRGLTERISTVEQNQNTVGQGIQTLETKLTQTNTETTGLIQAAAAIRAELSEARSGLTEIQTNAKARHEVELRTAESIRRLETVIAGTQTKGAAGENILEAVFAKLPVDWQVRNFTVGNKSVEFALRLPNGRILPIDSKWAATTLLEEFVSCNDLDRQLLIKGNIETTVLAKAKEVRKYLDPNLTMDFGIAAVPDAIYDLCCGIHSAIFQQNVILISYSMFLPYLLLVFQTVLKSSSSIDLQKLDSYLKTTEQSLTSLQDELEGRFSRAITMLTNSRGDMSVLVSKARNGITSLQISTNTPQVLESHMEPVMLEINTIASLP